MTVNSAFAFAKTCSIGTLARTVFQMAVAYDGLTVVVKTVDVMKTTIGGGICAGAAAARQEPIRLRRRNADLHDASLSRDEKQARFVSGPYALSSCSPRSPPYVAPYRCVLLLCATCPAPFRA